MGKSRFGRRLWGTVGVVSLFIDACGGGGGSSSSAGTPAAATQDPNAVAGGTLNLGVWQEPSSFLAAGITDMRRGFTGFSAVAQTVLEQNPYSGHVFVFRGKRGLARGEDCNRSKKR